VWKYVLARYGAYATTFLICGEYNKGSRGPARKDPSIREARIARIFKLGRFLKTSDPYKRVFGIHPIHSEVDPRPTWDESWCDLIMVQGGHDQNKSHRPYRIMCYRDLRARSETKPWVETESTFEGIEFAYWNRPGGNGPAEVRDSAYTPLQYGACGFSYGANSLWYPTQDENDQTFAQWGKPIPWWEAVRRPGAAQMAHLRNCYESVAWWRLLPVETSRVLDCKLSDADRNYPPLVRAENDQTLLIYFPRRESECKAYLKVGSSAARYRVTLFDPRTGESDDSELACRSERTLLPPLPDRQDWIMILRKQED
jgi:hypothetical protein